MRASQDAGSRVYVVLLTASRRRREALSPSSVGVEEINYHGSCQLTKFFVRVIVLIHISILLIFTRNKNNKLVYVNWAHRSSLLAEVLV